MKAVHYFLGIVFSLCLVITLLITSIEAAAYWIPGLFETEYTKYNVAEDVQMEMDDLLEVTEEMMAYLKGDREDLHVPTVVNGEPREFFSEREIAHMEDVQGLFLAAQTLRRICIILGIAALALMVLLKAKMSQVLPRAVCIGTGVFFAVICIGAAVVSTDFNKYFIIFHHIFFTNDLWLLDPEVDLLINIVPEPFFVDIAALIAIIFGVCILIIFGVCLAFIITGSRKAKK